MSWRVQVDFDGDGDFWKTANQLTADIREGFRVSSGGRPFEMLGDEAGLELIVTNTDRKYSPEHAGSPLYGKLKPGKAVRVLFDQAGAGITGQYYNQEAGDPGPRDPVVLARTDTTINFTWAGSPGTGVNADYFAVRWRALLTVPTTGSYTFYANVTNDVRLWIGGTAVVNQVYSGAATEFSGVISLTAGQPYDLVMEFAHATGSAQCQLRYTGPGIGYQIVPAARFALPPWVLWQGTIEEVKPAPLRFGPRTARILCVGQKATLERARLGRIAYEEYPDLYTASTSTKVEDVIRSALSPKDAWLPEVGIDASGIRLGGRGLWRFGDAIRTDPNIPPAAYDVLLGLVEFEGGKLFYNRDRWEFWPRGYQPDPDTTADLTLDNTAEAIDYGIGLDAVINQADYTASPRSVGAVLTTVFKLTDWIEIAYGETVILYFPYAIDGQPVTVSGWVTELSFDEFSESQGPHVGGYVDRDYVELGYGRFVKVGNFWFDVMRISAWELGGYLVEDGEPAGGTVEDDPSVAAYGPRGVGFSSPYAETRRQAKDQADWFVRQYAEPVPACRSVTVSGKADGVDNLDQLQYGVGDVVRVIDYQTALDRRHLIVGEEHAIDVPSDTHTTTWYLEPATDWRIMVLNQGQLNRDHLLY